MDRAGPQDRRDELVGFAIEDEQGEVLVLGIVAVVGGALLLAMRWIVGPVQVEHEVGGDACLFPLPEIDLAQRLGQAVAGAGADRVLHAGEGRLAGQIGIAFG